MDENIKKAEYYYKKGVELGNKGDIEKALEYFDKAIQLNPFYRDAYFNKALALRILGRYDEARECFFRGLAVEKYLMCKKQNINDEK
ncbi:tetratricopeptide repeat protein [Methanocaldococcus sp. 16A]